MAHAASPIYSWEWTTEGTQITAPGWNGSFNYTTGNDYATFGSGSGGGTPYNSGIAGISGSFTVSFDLKNLSSTNNAWKDVFSLYSNGTVSGGANSRSENQRHQTKNKGKEYHVEFQSERNG